MNYQQSLELMHDLCKFGINPGLSRIEQLLSRLGNPERRIRNYIHISGTNGKGSVAAMLDSILRAEGRKTGFFSSPHLHSHTERYRMDGQPIAEDDFAAIISEIAPHIQAMVADGYESPTEFELATVCAFCHFARSAAEWAVVEVGMGGSIDSTNVIDAKYAVITNVALDHCQYLGTSIDEIAKVKSGIIKQGAVVVSGATDVALSIIEEACAEQNGQILVMDRDFSLTNCSINAEGGSFDLQTSQKLYRNLVVPLLGGHQLANAAIAVTMAEQVGCSESAIREGLLRVKWPARLEIVSREPLILLDGAHNVHGMAALTVALAELWPNKRKVALLGMLADKERGQALSLLLPYIDRAVITPPPYASRVGDWRYLAELCAANYVHAQAIEDNRAALTAALAEVGREDMLVVCGSLYLVAEIRRMLLNV